jgi:hypothetical protein
LSVGCGAFKECVIVFGVEQVSELWKKGRGVQAGEFTCAAHYFSMLLTGLILLPSVVKMCVSISPLMMGDEYQSRGEFSCPEGSSVACGGVLKMIMHVLYENLGNSTLEKRAPAEAVMGDCHRRVI